MATRVIFRRDGEDKEFGCFISRSWAEYHVALAKSTSGIKGYVNYDGGEFIYEEYDDEQSNNRKSV